jgi:hypothetical protein
MHIQKTRQTFSGYFFASFTKILSRFKISWTSKKTNLNKPAMISSFETGKSINLKSLKAGEILDTELTNELLRLQETAQNLLEDSDEVIRIEGLSKSFDDIGFLSEQEYKESTSTILDNLWFAVRKGECFGFLVNFANCFFRFFCIYKNMACIGPQWRRKNNNHQHSHGTK